MISQEGEDLGDEKDLNKNCFIFVNKSLTGTNRKLLIQDKKLEKGLYYNVPGYTIYGQVRVRKSENTEYIAIRNREGLNKIMK